jgi:hypothetical protein
MTRLEAKSALKTGKKITHKYFNNEEWVRFNPEFPYSLIDQDGLILNWDEFWYYRQDPIFDEGWEIYTKT